MTTPDDDTVPVHDPEASAASGRPAASADEVPWYRRVVPLVLALALVVGAAAALLPPVRHQLALSLTRRPEPYVALYFARTPSGQSVCSRVGDRVQVRFVISSALQSPRSVAYRVAVTPEAGHRRTAAGAVATTPGSATGAVRVFRIRRGHPYSVRVALPDSGQEIRARCSKALR